jgi:NADP-dependent 3-hydroxy acid dehydrogenase YdfG
MIIFATMKRAIIVGASSGMGRKVSEILLADGWHIGVAARRIDALNEIKALNPSMVVTEQIDVTNADAPQHLLNLVDRLGGVNLYFHASGIGFINSQLDADLEMATANTNVLGFTRMIDTIFNYMADHCGGRIAVISSIAGTKGLGPAPSYSASKAFQNTYIQSLEQLSNSRHLQITFTDIRPGFVDTALLAGGTYPMLMDSGKVARAIVHAIYAGKHICVVDWRYRIMTFLWRLIPNFVWRKLNLLSKNQKSK